MLHESASPRRTCCPATMHLQTLRGLHLCMIRPCRQPLLCQLPCHCLRLFACQTVYNTCKNAITYRHLPQRVCQQPLLCQLACKCYASLYVRQYLRKLPDSPTKVVYGNLTNRPCALGERSACAFLALKTSHAVRQSDKGCIW